MRQRRPLITYQLYDAAALALTPARWSAAAAKSALRSPFNPWSYSWAGRSAAAAADVFEGVTLRRTKPEWRLDAVPEVVDERPFCRLLRFTRDPHGRLPRVLLVAPLSGHYATLLRGTVAGLLAGHDVYVTDWTDARDVPLAAGTFDLSSDVGYILDYLRLLGPDVHAIGVCQPVPAVLAAVALLAAADDPAQPRTMTLMGGPIDTRRAPTAPTRLAEQHDLEWFARELTATVPPYYAGAGRRVYPGFLQLSAFLAMNPVRHIDAHIAMYNDLVRGDGESARSRRAFYDEYLAVMDVTAEYFLQTVDEVFQRRTLATGTMTWHGERVAPEAIERTALLTVEGELDDISAPGQTLAAHDLTPNIAPGRRMNLVEPGVGHYGIFNGSRWRSSILPRIAAFIATHS